MQTIKLEIVNATRDRIRINPLYIQGLGFLSLGLGFLSLGLGFLSLGLGLGFLPRVIIQLYPVMVMQSHYLTLQSSRP